MQNPEGFAKRLAKSVEEVALGYYNSGWADGVRATTAALEGTLTSKQSLLVAEMADAKLKELEEHGTR